MKRKLVVLLMSEGCTCPVAAVPIEEKEGKTLVESIGSSLVDLFFESDLAQQVARHYGCHGGAEKDVN